MYLIDQFFILFIIYSFIGWIWETIYCSLKSGRYENRGFLLGPVCPIYGFGGILISIIYLYIHNYQFNWYQIFLISFLGSIPLEYFTSVVLEKLFHATWWDYHDMKLNINGRVCLPASLCFGLCGVFVVYFLLPQLSGLIIKINPICIQLLSLTLMAILSADIAITVSSITELNKKVASIESLWNEQMEAIVHSVSIKKDDVISAISKIKPDILEIKSSNILSGMTYLQKVALKRVKEFKPVKNIHIFNTVKSMINKIPAPYEKIKSMFKRSKHE